MSVAPAEKAIFPLDKQLGISNSVYSHDLAQQMVWLSGLLPYAQCEQVFERIGGRMLPASSIWQRFGQASSPPSFSFSYSCFCVWSNSFAAAD